MKKILFALLLIFAATSVFHVAQAAVSGNDGTGVSGNAPQASQPAQKLQNPLKVTSIKEVIFLAVNIMVYIGVSFAILAIIFVGFKFVMAQGKPEEISKAKEWFLYIIIGLAILISAKVIVEIIQNTLVKSGVVNEKLWEP